MTKIVMLAVALLASTAWLQAQQYPPDNSKQTGPSQTKIEGCVQGSDGNFTLTDSSGTTYQLQGDTAKLTEHVGHEVQITGSTSGGAGDNANSASAGAASQPSLNVKSIKHVSKTCKSTNKSFCFLPDATRWLVLLSPTGALGEIQICWKQLSG